MPLLNCGYESPVTSSDEEVVEEINLSVKRRKLNNIIGKSLPMNDITQGNKKFEIEPKINDLISNKDQSYIKISSIIPVPKNDKPHISKFADQIDNSKKYNKTNSFEFLIGEEALVDQKMNNTQRKYNAGKNNDDYDSEDIFEILRKRSTVNSNKSICFREKENLIKQSLPSSSDIRDNINTSFEALPIPDIIDPLFKKKSIQAGKNGKDTIVASSAHEGTSKVDISRKQFKNGIKMVEFNVNDYYNANNSEKSSHDNINGDGPGNSTAALKKFNVHGKNQFSSLATYAQDSKNNEVLQEKFKREKQYKIKNNQRYGF